MLPPMKFLPCNDGPIRETHLHWREFFLPIVRAIPHKMSLALHDFADVAIPREIQSTPLLLPLFLKCVRVELVNYFLLQRFQKKSCLRVFAEVHKMVKSMVLNIYDSMFLFLEMNECTTKNFPLLWPFV